MEETTQEITTQELSITEVITEVNTEVNEAQSEEQFNLAADYFDPEKQDEKLWQDRTGLNYDTLCGAIETIIFMSDRPVPLLKIKKMIDEAMPLNVLHDSIVKLQAEYEAAHHGLRLQEVAEGYQFRTKATYSKYVQDLFKVNALVLTPSVLEVLAIIAYKQPVSRPDIDKVRGVDSAHLIRTLMEKHLVKIVGRSEDVGHPSMYGTTQEFLEVFNLASIEALPPEHELKDLAKSSEVGKIADIRQICSEGDKKRFMFDELAELDQLSESIKHVVSETDFTRNLVSEEKKRVDGLNPDVKTAFEILEEYIERQRIIEQNRQSITSEGLNVVAGPKVVVDLTAGPFNAPLAEEDDFQMIDLDTGLPIAAEPEKEELLFKEDERDLAQALDRAFFELTGEKLPESKDADFNLEEANTFFEEDKLDALTETMVDQGKALDLDLEFLKEKNPETDVNQES